MLLSSQKQRASKRYLEFAENWIPTELHYENVFGRRATNVNNAQANINTSYYDIIFVNWSREDRTNKREMKVEFKTKPGKCFAIIEGGRARLHNVCSSERHIA